MKRSFQVLLVIYLPSVCCAHAAPVDVDSTFDSGSGGGFEPGIIRALVAQPDGKVLVGGNIFEIGGAERLRIARLNADGLADTTFDPGTGANGAILSIVLLPGGKLLAGGSFTTINDTKKNGVARLNPNGSLDMTFDPGTGPKRGLFIGEGRVWSVALQTDGKALVGGNFTGFNGVDRNLIARLNDDGTVDPLFDPGTGADGTIVSIARVTDGKVLIAGNFTTPNQPGGIGIARLNADGSLDGTFSDSLGTNASVNSFVLETDGKVVVGGVKGDTKKGFVARLSADGALDNSFNPGTGGDHAVLSVAVQTDGKVLVGGDFTTFDDTNQNYLTRLNADGSLDSTFSSGTGADNTVWSVVVQTDGRLLVGGDFNVINGMPRVSVARLLGNAPVVSSIPLNIQKLGDQVLLTWASPSFSLQSAPAVDGPVRPISGATSPHTNSVTGSQLYFQLRSP